MDRRSFIGLALAFGGSLSLPVSRCLAAVANATEPAELILPQTDTPGALAAGVPQFIDFMLAEGFADPEREHFLAGLDEVEGISQREFKLPFLELAAQRQVTILQQLEAATGTGTSADNPGFFRVLKELTLIGYYTSEPGATLEARYVPMPGRYEACVPLLPGDRAFADGTPLDTLL